MIPSIVGQPNVRNSALMIRAASICSTEHLPPNGKVLLSAIQTADYTVQLTDSIIRFNADPDNLTCNLPTAASANKRRFTIKTLFSSVGQVTIKPNGSERIEDQSLYRLVNPGESITIYSNGSSWEIESSWQGL